MLPNAEMVPKGAIQVLRNAFFQEIGPPRNAK